MRCAFPVDDSEADSEAEAEGGSDDEPMALPVLGIQMMNKLEAGAGKGGTSAGTGTGTGTGMRCVLPSKGSEADSEAEAEDGGDDEPMAALELGAQMMMMNKKQADTLVGQLVSTTPANAARLSRDEVLATRDLLARVDEAIQL